MGMYTELIFGADLKKDTPDHVIESIKFICGQIEEVPSGFPFDTERRTSWILRGSSGYFPCEHCLFEKSEYGNRYVLNTRSSIKNYLGEIEEFLSWIEPYIDSGSGGSDMYAIVIYEEADKPTIYYKNYEL